MKEDVVAANLANCQSINELKECVNRQNVTTKPTGATYKDGFG